jgi:hypothetical protein
MSSNERFMVAVVVGALGFKSGWRSRGFDQSESKPFLIETTR